MDEYILKILEANEAAQERVEKSKEYYAEYQQDFEQSVQCIEAANEEAFKIESDKIQHEMSEAHARIESEIEGESQKRLERLQQQFQKHMDVWEERLFEEIVKHE